MTSAGSTAPADREESRDLLRYRLGRFGLYGSINGWFFLAIRLTGSDGSETITSPSMIYHLLASLSLSALWLAAHLVGRSSTALRAADAILMVMACTFYAFMGSELEAYSMPHYIVLLALSFGLVTRAIYVPSSAKFTAFLTTLCGVPLLVATYRIYSDIDVQAYKELAPDIINSTAPELARGMVYFTGAWWLIAIGICTGASRVIYGLRKQVQDVRKLGQYTLVEKLGEGGMGVVYRAQHAMLRRPTAVKLLPADKVGAVSLARFEKEVQLTAMLSHPNTVTVFDYGRTPDDVFYYAMELLDGATLAEVVELGGPLSPARTIHIMEQAAGALAEAHGIKLIHRDIKPVNIMLVEQGGSADVTKVLDFGLVKELKGMGDASLTQVDSVTGTPLYLAPEAISAPSSVDERSDIYALGAVGYYLLTGHHVFGGSTTVEICSHHLHSKPEPPSKRTKNAIPADLEALILSCLEKKPADRPQDANTLVSQLAACEDHGKWTQADARSWWQEHSPELDEQQQESLAKQSSEASLTMDIDLARRQKATRRG
jgi:serine/threonine protein kinase